MKVFPGSANRRSNSSSLICGSRSSRGAGSRNALDAGEDMALLVAQLDRLVEVGQFFLQGRVVQNPRHDLLLTVGLGLRPGSQARSDREAQPAKGANHSRRPTKPFYAGSARPAKARAVGRIAGLDVFEQPLVPADVEVAEGHGAGIGDVVGLGERSRPSSAMIACWTCDLGARPLPVSVFLIRVAA